MSAESQSEHIWRYAMRPDSSIGDARNAPLNAINDASGGSGGGGMVTTTDLSEDFGSMSSQFNFHGLDASQGQNQGAWFVHGKSEPQGVGGTESQKENMQLRIPSGSQSPLLSATNPTFHSADARKTMIGASSKSSHVTEHVTSASPARADATLLPLDTINDSAPFSSGSAPLIKERDPIARATPLKLNNQAVTFRSPTAPPSPPTPIAPRTKTMPPRLNRYAPRDIPPSSQDSFAGPPVALDLNEFARTSRILNNTFIHTNARGRVEAVYHPPSHLSSTSRSEPAVADDVMSISQSEQPGGTTASQIIRAAFDPNLSPPRPEPLVLARDSQPEHQASQDSERAIDAPDVSSSSGSFHLPSPDADAVLTQPNSQTSQQNMQPTQHNTQPTQVVPPPDASHPPSVNTNPVGPSPLPVPAHRRRQFAALEAARLRARDEIVPETPLSTLAPSVTASAPPPVHQDESPSEVGEGEIQYIDVSKPHSKRLLGEDALGAMSVKRPPQSSNRVTRHTAGKLPEAASEPPKVAMHKQPLTKYGPPGSEVVPDSQEDEQDPDHTGSPSRKRQREGDIVPDSQEERPADSAAPPSSPAIPLKELRPRRNAREEPRTLTPAAVKSPLRKGRLPEGVTHTRGRPSDAKDKGKGKAKAVETESDNESWDRGDAAAPMQENAESMDVDKEQPPTDVVPPVRGPKNKRAPARSVKKEKRTSAPVSSRKSGKKAPQKGTTTTNPAPGPSTRSKKRKSDTPAGSAKDDTPTPSAPPAKRQRKTKPITPTPVVPTMSSTRVFARRADRGNYYFPGTVNIMTGSSSSTRASTVFRVKFDDGVEDDMDVQLMRRFELENADNVHIKWPAKHKDCAAEVISVERWDAELVDVQELHVGPDGEDFEVSSKFISISEARIRQQFSERRISSRLLRGDLDFDVPFDIPAENQRLAGMGFVITLPDLPRGKRSLKTLITASGGVVYEEWNSLISLDGKVESPGRQMSGTRDKVRMKKGMSGQLFCLADEARTTPKYLIALALGVPCLSYEWVLERALKPDDVHKVDWPAYVLPAGYNSTTRLPASQAFDRVWWRQSGNISKLISNPPTFKPFLRKSFLCLGNKEFLFSQNELGIFPKLLLAMGASYVEAVTDITHVKKPPAQFNYTVVDDGETLSDYQDALSVDVWWIKKCLVAGIEGPVPWPDPDRLR